MHHPPSDSPPRLVKGFPSRKRRKVVAESGLENGAAAALDTGSSAGPPPLAPRPPPASTFISAAAAAAAAAPTCVSCHRSLRAATKPAGPGPPPPPLHCSLCVVPSRLPPAIVTPIAFRRCHASTCLICARHCNDAAPPAPRSAPLANTNLNAHDEHPAPSPRGRRRKFDEDTAQGGGGGCGRTLCRQCCVENEATHLYSCLECVGYYRDKEEERKWQVDTD
ncbi:hypothetical protein BU17DRAFT_101028 [Hysterangium stoloniferum]|nr:hypothetical protein BU17DRAFT_101028 [Hysterangium stoloniferum]